MNYQEYLKTQHWKTKRAEAIELYGSCVLCGSSSSLHVHHRHYRTLWREDCTKDVIVLCDKHHRETHEEDAPEFVSDGQERGDYIDQVFMALTQAWQR